MFDPHSAGIGIHTITYQTMPDKFGCVGTDTVLIEVIMPPGPIADFKPDTAGCSPLFVQFMNMSSNGETYLWDFGDNTMSTEISPSHTYNFPGNYIVRLTVTNLTGQSTHNSLIEVYQSPSAVFSVYPTDVINNSQVVIFTNFSSDAISWLWNFGDGNTSMEENPWHKYLSEGTYMDNTGGCFKRWMQRFYDLQNTC